MNIKFGKIAKYLCLGFFGCIMMGVLFTIHHKLMNEDNSVIIVLSIFLWAGYIALNIIDAIKFK